MDNYIDQDQFKAITDVVMGPDFTWHYSYSVADGQVEEDEIYFCHLLYMGLAEMPKDGSMPEPPKKSQFYDLFEPVFNRLPDFSLLLRAKVNLYGRTQEIVHHPDHVDMTQPHRGGVFSLNTCNGGTIINGEKFDSVANRMLFFDPSKPHHSTTCTDSKRRVNININYI
jgi:hypothetical protein